MAGREVVPAGAESPVRQELSLEIPDPQNGAPPIVIHFDDQHALLAFIAKRLLLIPGEITAARLVEYTILRMAAGACSIGTGLTLNKFTPQSLLVAVLSQNSDISDSSLDDTRRNLGRPQPTHPPLSEIVPAATAFAGTNTAILIGTHYFLAALGISNCSTAVVQVLQDNLSTYKQSEAKRKDAGSIEDALLAPLAAGAWKDLVDKDGRPAPLPWKAFWLLVANIPLAVTVFKMIGLAASQQALQTMTFTHGNEGVMAKTYSDAHMSSSLEETAKMAIFLNCMAVVGLCNMTLSMGKAFGMHTAAGQKASELVGQVAAKVTSALGTVTSWFSRKSAAGTAAAPLLPTNATANYGSAAQGGATTERMRAASRTGSDASKKSDGSPNIL